MDLASYEFPKINSIFHREAFTKKNNLIWGKWSQDEFADPTRTWITTEKVDGVNIRLHYDENGKLTVKGRKNNSEVPKKLHEILKEKYGNCGLQNVVVVGEGYGRGLGPSSKIMPEGQDFIAFHVEYGVGPHVYDATHFKWVPVVDHTMTMPKAIGYVMTNPKSILIPGIDMEGIVLRSADFLCKLKWKDFKEFSANPTGQLFMKSITDEAVYGSIVKEGRFELFGDNI